MIPASTMVKGLVLVTAHQGILGAKIRWKLGSDGVAAIIMKRRKVAGVGFRAFQMAGQARVLWLFFALAFAVGCKAQTGIQDPVLARRIEVLVRTEFNVPADYAVSFGVRKPSNVPGFDLLEILLSKGDHKTMNEFLISADNKTLARLERWDLEHIPAQNIGVAGRPVRGNPNAKVTVINFDDLECPYCARMHQQLFPLTLERYHDKVKFVYKDDPLVEIHPWAMHAAVDSNCIADQNGTAYWGYVDYLHSHGQDVSGADRNLQKSYAELDKIAREQGKIFALDAAKLDACLQKQDESSVRASMREADSLKVEGTPYIFIDGERINGALPVEQVWIVIDRALRAAGVEPPPALSPASQAPKLGQ